MKKIISKLLFVLMLISCLSVNVFAESNVVLVDEESDFIVDESQKDKEITFVLENDLNLEKALVISQDINLYLNGKTLTIQEEVLDDEGVIKEGTGYGILVDKGMLSIYGGNLDDSDGQGIIQGKYENSDEGKILKSGVIILVNENGILNFHSGTIKYGCSANGGGIANKGTTNIYGGTITYCISEAVAGGHGGGIWNGNELNIYDGEISNCSAHVGGGIYNWLNAVTNIKKIKIENCSASEAGGGIYTAGDSTLIVDTDEPKESKELYDAQFLIMNCSAGYIGGGIAISPGDKVELKNDIMIILNHAPSCSGIANGAMGDGFPGYLKIAGKVIIMGNHSDDFSKQQNNLGILDDSYITVDGKLLPGTDIGVHMYDFCEGHIVMKGLDPTINPDYHDDDDIQIAADFDPHEEVGDKGDSLTIDKNGNLLIKIAKFEVAFDTDGYGTIEPQYIERGRYAKEPETLKRYGYYVDGWYYEDDKLPWVFGYDKVNSHLTLTAQWKQFVDSDNISTTLNTKHLKNLSIKINEKDRVLSSIGVYDFSNKKEIARWSVLNNSKKLPYEIIDLGENRKEIIIHKSLLKNLKEGQYEIQLYTQKMNIEGEVYDVYLTGALLRIVDPKPIDPIIPVKPEKKVDPIPYVVPNTSVR